MSNKQTPCHGCDHGWGCSDGRSCHDDCPELKAFQETHPKPYKDWTLAEAKAFCAERGPGRDDYDPCDDCPLWSVLCANEPTPEKWWLHAFTPAEVEEAKAIKKLFPTAITVEKRAINGLAIVMRNEDGQIVGSFNSVGLLSSVEFHEVVKLDDIIGEG